MNIRALYLVPAAAVAMIATPAAAQTVPAETVEFQIKGDNFVLDMPEGYCLPDAAGMVLTKRFADADPVNVTPVDIQRCGTFGSDYVLIKSPKAMPEIPFGKAAFLSILKQQASSEAGQAEIDKGVEQGTDSIEKEFDGEVAVQPNKIAYDGADEDCVYLAGSVTISAEGGGAALINVGTCMTVVGTRHIAVHSYSFADGGDPIDVLKARSRQVALATSPK